MLALGALLLTCPSHLLAKPDEPESLRYRTFWMPSSSMAPTIIAGDRMFADMKPKGDPGRGDLVVIGVRNEQWIKRIVALPGDRIAMHAGLVILNGQTIAQTANGEYELANDYGAPPDHAQKLLEQLPGETHPHEVLELGVTRQDEMPEIVLGLGQYFLLGDNRDNSMDSRMADRPLEGLGLVSRDRILGRILYRYWRIGEGWRRVDL